MPTSTTATNHHHLLRRVLATLAVVVAALVFSSTAAFAALLMGTDQNETITGTKKADKISGLGGNDFLLGRAGNDTYLFDDGFGEDALEELKKYGKRAGGSDLVDFSEVSDSEMKIGLVPEWPGTDLGFQNPGAQAFAFPGGSATGKVDFTKTAPERATGGAQDDIIVGGKEKNVLRGGPGDNVLMDGGGMPAGNPQGLPALAASDDTFIAGEDEDDIVLDLAGKADTLDLRAMGNFGEVSIMTDRQASSLIFLSADESAAVVVMGGVAPAIGGQQNGVMEKVVFADGAKSAAEVLARTQSSEQAQEASSASSSSANDQQQLAERAKKLVEDAQASLPILGKNAAGK